MAQPDAISGAFWYRTLSREQWRVLFASNLGWLFDGFEIYALFLTVGFALHRRAVPAGDQGAAAAARAVACGPGAIAESGRRLRLACRGAHRRSAAGTPSAASRRDRRADPGGA
jgi:hypothetical protein